MIVVPYQDDFDIPQEVQDEGLILMYVRVQGVIDPPWHAVPNPFVPDVLGNVQLQIKGPGSITAEIRTNDIRLILRRVDGEPVPPLVAFDLAALRVVIVPPGTVISPNRVPADLIGLSYNEVTTLLGIPE